jgi:hypothetical protein
MSKLVKLDGKKTSSSYCCVVGDSGSIRELTAVVVWLNLALQFGMKSIDLKAYLCCALADSSNHLRSFQRSKEFL